MSKQILKGRAIVDGEATGQLLCIRTPVSFLGMLNPSSGELKVEGVVLSIPGKVLAIPGTIGSTVAPYIIYQTRKLNTAPAAIISKNVDTYLASGCAVSKIPLVELKNEFDDLCRLSGSAVRVLPGGLIEVE